MAKLSKKQRTQLSALLSAFPSSGLTSRISRNIAKYFKSFVGRDFKALAQMALFVLSPFLAPAEIEVWLALSKRKSKIHLLLLLPEHMRMFGPTSSYNTERAYSYSPSERCGDDLIALYRSMGVQRYLGGTSVQHDKPIHQPGTLRKHVGSSELGSIVLNAPDLGCRWGRWQSYQSACVTM
ncbi:hypothetical protein EMCRGX_G026710 [Ephydatia muelleri]